VDTADFDYELPEARIAQRPVEPRDSARLLVDLGPAADTIAEPGVEHVQVHDLVDQLDPGDVVVEPAPPRYRTGGGVLQVVVGDDIGDGVRLVRLEAGGGDLSEAIERVGEIPLPPYITTPLGDPDRYQTVYSDLAHPDSSAAPTAGLHITPEVLEVMSARGVAVVDVELVVGLGTFRPIEVDRVEDHHMHRERYRVPRSTLDACNRAHDRGGRVVAVGTTAVRALESAAATGRLEGHTELFIREGFAFRVVDRLLTNFHLPRSSLLVMVDAFAGPRWRELYQAALAGDYRFLSFGDAMLLTRVDRWSEPTEDHRP
jgi:S-adenosylmethionine:tRNA ribosyltransferase-isomerase